MPEGVSLESEPHRSCAQATQPDSGGAFSGLGHLLTQVTLPWAEAYILSYASFSPTQLSPKPSDEQGLFVARLCQCRSGERNERGTWESGGSRQYQCWRPRASPISHQAALEGSERSNDEIGRDRSSSIGRRPIETISFVSFFFIFTLSACHGRHPLTAATRPSLLKPPPSGRLSHRSPLLTAVAVVAQRRAKPS